MILNSRFTQHNTIQRFDLETMFDGEKLIRGASVDFAYDSGGPIIRHIIENAPREHLTRKSNVSVKLLNLVPEAYSAIPGWHSDGLLLNQTQDPSQYTSCKYCSISIGDIAPTISIDGTFEIPLDMSITGMPFWRHFDSHISNMIERDGLEVIKQPSNTFITFDYQGIHSTSESTGYGKRMFVKFATDESVDVVHHNNATHKHSNLFFRY